MRIKVSSLLSSYVAFFSLETDWDGYTSSSYSHLNSRLEIPALPQLVYDRTESYTRIRQQILYRSHIHFCAKGGGKQTNTYKHIRCHMYKLFFVHSCFVFQDAATLLNCEAS